MVYDITIPISNTMPVWPSDPPVKLLPESHLSRDKSHAARVTAIEMGSHTGTHIDAPYHFVDGGRRLHEIPVEQLIGPATVFEVRGARAIGRKDLERRKWDGIQKVLFKTENSSHWRDGKFYEDFVYLEPEGAEFLAEHELQLVGIDYLSIDKFKSEKHPSHFVLLSKNIVILEGLDLSSVPEGDYTLYALPLNLHNGDGAPTRAILLK